MTKRFEQSEEGIPSAVIDDSVTGQEIYAHNLEALEVAKESDEHREEASVQEQHSGIEGIFENAETDSSATRDACVEDTKIALGKKLTVEQRQAIAELAGSTRKIIDSGIESSDKGMRDTLELILRNHYNLTLEELLGAFKPTKLELLYPGTMPGAVATEVSIFAISKALDIEPVDLSLAKKIEYRAKVSADMLKVLALITKFIPSVSAASIPLGMAGFTLERVSGAMSKINNKEDVTILDGAKEVILASLPRDKNGNIDREAVRAIIEKTGGMIAESGSDSDYIKSVGEHIKNNPELVIEAVEQLSLGE